MDNRIENYIREGENYRLDFKETAKLVDRKGLAEHLAAFANRRGGTLIFGITDSGMLEGADIDEDSAVKSLTEASSTWCSPPVTFTTKLYPSQFDGVKKGDVLEVNIDRARDTPCAVGTKKERVFYIRSGNSKRPITDPNELDWLFKRSLPGSIEYYTDVRYPVVATDFSPAGIEPLPEGYQHISKFFNELSEEDIAYLQKKTEHLNRFIYEVMPFALLRSIGGDPDFWIRYSDITLAQIRDGNTIVSNTDEMYLSDLQFDYKPVLNESGQKSIFSDLSIDPIAVMGEDKRTIVHPEDMSISIEYLNEAVTRIRIQKEDAFDFVIESGRSFGNAMSGLPDIHPLQAEYSSENRFKTAETYLGFEGQFEFPDQEDPNMDQHYAFADGWTEFLQRKWDMEERIENSWNEIYRLSEKVSRIEKRLDEEL